MSSPTRWLIMGMSSAVVVSLAAEEARLRRRVATARALPAAVAYSPPAAHLRTARFLCVAGVRVEGGGERAEDAAELFCAGRRGGRGRGLC